MGIFNDVLYSEEFDIIVIHPGDEGAEGEVLHVSDFFEFGVDIGADLEEDGCLGGFAADGDFGRGGDGDVPSVVGGG
jgi:hypothetical protein